MKGCIETINTNTPKPPFVTNFNSIIKHFFCFFTIIIFFIKPNYGGTHE